MPPRSNSFVAAATPEPYVVLGLQLRPFCLGHYVWLRRFGCAFVGKDKAIPERADLILACLVCSMTFDEFGAWIHAESPSRFKRIATMARLALRRAPLGVLRAAWRQSAAELAVASWGQRVGFFDLSDKAELFARYLKEHSEMPKIWFEQDTKESGGDWAQNVFLVLTGDCGFTSSEAWNMPLREAFLHFFRHCEKSGTVSLMTDDEIELAEEAA